MPVTSPAEPLRRLLGDAVLTGPAAERFSVAGVAPAAVIAPTNVEQIAAALATARENGWTVEPAGAGTWLQAGRRPPRADLVLSTEPMREIREYEPADLTIGVDAGMSLSTLQREVGRHRQVVALDPPGSTAGTIGATFSTASAGPLRLGLGTPRDHALGVEIVTGDGRVLRLGGRVVKNVAGYDLVRLLVGSRGTLGIISRLHLRLRPLPERDVTLALFAADAAQACDWAGGLLAQASPVALEIISPGITRRLLHDDRWALLLRLQGNAGAVDDARAGVREVLRNAGPVPAASANVRPMPGEDGGPIWAALRELEGRAPLYVRVADLPARLESTLELAHTVALAGASAQRVHDWAYAAHAGDGIVRMWRMTPPAHGAATAASVHDARRTLADRGGTVHVPVGAAWLDAELEPFAGADDRALLLMRALKRAFDPENLLAPWRLFA